MNIKYIHHILNNLTATFTTIKIPKTGKNISTHFPETMPVQHQKNFMHSMLRNTSMAALSKLYAEI